MLLFSFSIFQVFLTSIRSANGNVARGSAIGGIVCLNVTFRFHRVSRNAVDALVVAITRNGI